MYRVFVVSTVKVDVAELAASAAGCILIGSIGDTGEASMIPTEFNE